MSKRVVVIASGETERRSIPYLVKHLQSEDVFIVEVRRPDGNKALNVEMAERLIKAAWYAPPDNVAPDKFVILLDADGKDPEQILSPFREGLAGRLGPKITATLQFACAQWHLEAWYFADAPSLKAYLGRDPGNVDISHPDDIPNPKLHLKHLLGDRAYTAVVSEEIARQLDAHTIARRSGSFRVFLQALRNGNLGPGSIAPNHTAIGKD